MKIYLVESRQKYTDCFDNYCFDYIYADNEDEAIEIYKECIKDNTDFETSSYTISDMDNWEYKVTEVNWR